MNVHINNEQFSNQSQTEGNNTKNNKSKLNSVSYTDNKVSVDESSNFSMPSTIPPPPPPPPSLVTGNPKDHAAIRGLNSISPTRHYRIQYSLGVQQDMCNVMSVPRGSNGRELIFGSDNSDQTVTVPSLPQNSFLKPPSSSKTVTFTIKSNTN